MLYDFSRSCKSYDAGFYKKGDFAETGCPKCCAVGRFKLHGAYRRHVIYADSLVLMRKFTLVHKHMEIKRIKCRSCKSTHAVMPWDLIPYMLLSLLIVLFILALYYFEETPVLRIAEGLKSSHQFIYSILSAFRLHASRIYAYFREISCGAVKLGLCGGGIVALIKEPYAAFQSGYFESYRRPCFMCKFFGSPGAPPVGRKAPLPPHGGQQHNP